MSSTRAVPVRVWAPIAAASDEKTAAPLLDRRLTAASAERFSISDETLRAARVTADERGHIGNLVDNKTGPRAAVLVSPGRGDPSWTNATLCCRIAEADGIAIEIGHPGDGPTLDTAGSVVPSIRGLRDASILDDLHNIRVEDLAAVYDALLPGGSLALIGGDAAAISAVGHSLGGAASVDLATYRDLAAVVVFDGRINIDRFQVDPASPLLLLTANRDTIPEWSEARSIPGILGAWWSAPDIDHYSLTELATRYDEFGLNEWSSSRRETWLGTEVPGTARMAAIPLVLQYVGLDPNRGVGTLPSEPPSGWVSQWRR